MRTSEPGEILSSSLTPTSLLAERSESPVNRNPRSASPEPILSKVTATDDLLIYKNVEDALDTNDVELSGRIGGFINPSKTVCNTDHCYEHLSRRQLESELIPTLMISF